MKLSKQALVLLLCCLLVRVTAQAESFGPTGQSNDQQLPPPVQQSPKELQQLVAPIALYPDALVAQVLAASTYPTEIVEADRWMQSHSKLNGEELAKEVDKQPWDPSVKALAQFPSVLEDMDKNLSWTSSLGDAYANQQQEVTDAVQAMREQAHKAGHLNSNDQQKVTTQGKTIVIEPANPEVIYVPAYDPWLVYGEPIVAYPGWYPVPGIFLAGARIGFGIGFGVGFFGGYGWGWHHWGYDWHGRSVIYNHSTYISHSQTIINRNSFSHNSLNHGNFSRGNAVRGNGHSSFHAQPGTRSGAFSGFDHGGNVHNFSSRGRASFGGGSRGGGFHGGGGGRHR